MGYRPPWGTAPGPDVEGVLEGQRRIREFLADFSEAARIVENLSESPSEG